jgi:hypothetical protein
MTLPAQPERDAEQPGSDLPIPKLETPSPASPSSVDTDAIVKQVAEQLRREIRQAQSTKDKEIDAIKKGLGIGDLTELEAMGATIPENAKLEIRLRNLEAQRSAGNSPAQDPSSPGNGAGLTAQDVSEVVKKLQLDANDADVINALRGTYRNRDHFEAAMAGLALARINRQTPSPAEAPSLQSPPAPSSTVDVEALSAEHSRLLKNPSKNMARIREIQEQLSKAGS